MALKTTLVVATGIAGAFGLGTSQVDYLAQARETRREPTVSLRFQRATVGEVIERLSREQVSFVVADEELPRDKRITLNIVRQPLSDAMAALGTALGGHWQRRGAIYVFRKGSFDFDIPVVIDKKWQYNFNRVPLPFNGLRLPKGNTFKLVPPVTPAQPALPAQPGAKKPRCSPPAPVPTPRLMGGTITLDETLSEEQKEKERRQGYLNWEDLTPAQKRMLGPDPIEAGEIVHISGPDERHTQHIGLK